MVWDIGIYEVVEGNYWKGTLHISLKGKKLKGEWSLRRERAKGDNAWVLERLGEALKPMAAKKEDESALTGRTLAQIAEAQDAVWQSNRENDIPQLQAEVEAPSPTIGKSELHELPRTRPAFVEPMQAKLVERLPEGNEWEYEAKFDGYRVLIVKDKAVTVLSCRNKVLSHQFPTLTASCAHLQDGTVIDGEIIAIDEKLSLPAYGTRFPNHTPKSTRRAYAHAEGLAGPERRSAARSARTGDGDLTSAAIRHS